MLVNTAACQIKLAGVLLLLPLVQAITVMGPAYPPYAVSGGTVVAILHVSEGSVSSVDILQADEPFGSGTRAALEDWRFRASDSGNVLVVVSFRSTELYAAGDAARALAPKESRQDLAYPKKVVEPVYPPTSLAEGSVVLRVDVGESGSVSEVRVVQSLGGMDDACVNAVRKWQFVPAVNPKGNKEPSEAYAVCVVRRPVLAPKK